MDASAWGVSKLAGVGLFQVTNLLPGAWLCRGTGTSAASRRIFPKAVGLRLWGQGVVMQAVRKSFVVVVTSGAKIAKK